ncbi:MAG: hypothetical protein Q9169_001542 [Polycauliona sp. 2 TL-2023]
MSVQHVNDRLQPLNDAHKRTIQLIHRLSKHSIPPGSSSLNSDVRLQLSTDIHQTLKEQEEELELLRQEVDDQAITTAWTSSARQRNGGKEREHADIVAQLARLAEDLSHTRAQFRKAQLQAKRSAEAAKRKERELLFAGVQEGVSASGKGRVQGQEQLSKDQLEVNASSDVTAALRRVHSLMQSEVSRSQFALETLQSAFWILVVTISWLVFRRLLYGPGWWLLYLPITLVWQAAVFIIQSFFGAIAYTVGVLGGTPRSTSFEPSSLQASATLPEQPSATGEIPTFPAGMSAPFVRVGGGGKGQPPPQRPQDKRPTMSDAVGELAEKESKTIASGTFTTGEGSQGAGLRDRAPDEPPNPKKRMWEENAASQDGSRPRDEL